MRTKKLIPWVIYAVCALAVLEGLGYAGYKALDLQRQRRQDEAIRLALWRMDLSLIHISPQVWAWGSWRVAKLRRLTDLVLCLLPFEEGWFTTRGVPARFIGHPLFDHELDPHRVLERAKELPEFGQGEANGPWRIGLFPGSRPSELEKNLPLLLGAYRELAACERCRRDGRAPVAMIVAVNDAVEQRLRDLADRHGGVPEGVGFIAGDTDSAVRWSELTLVVSGTVTLQIARQALSLIHIS